MNVKRGFYWLAKYALLDELLGFIYWALALFGLFELISYLGVNGLSVFLTTALIALYVVLVTVVYICGLRRLTKFFSQKRLIRESSFTLKR